MKVRIKSLESIRNTVGLFFRNQYINHSNEPHSKSCGWIISDEVGEIKEITPYETRVRESDGLPLYVSDRSYPTPAHIEEVLDG